MAVGSAKACLGFLTVVAHEQLGLFGGYLVLNLAGRPLEFHCTTPIKANRAQQILYGATLQPYLYGEQIGATLIGKGAAKPLAVLTDQLPALAVRELIDVPVALILAAENRVGEASVESRKSGYGARTEITLGGNRLQVAAAYAQDAAEIAQRLKSLPESFDLAEPFGRIREAIEEAQRVGKRLAEPGAAA